MGDRCLPVAMQWAVRSKQDSILIRNSSTQRRMAVKLLPWLDACHELGIQWLASNDLLLSLPLEILCQRPCALHTATGHEVG